MTSEKRTPWRLAPSPASSPIVGHAWKFQHAPLEFLLQAARIHGPVTRLKLGPLTYHFVSEPSLVAEVLQTRAEHYLRETRSSRSIRIVTGESLLNTEGDGWRRLRRLAQPVFHHRALVKLGEEMLHAAAEAQAHWAQLARAGQPVDLVSEMTRLTFIIVGRCLFGTELGARAGEMEKAFPVLLDELFFRAKHAFAFPLWMPLHRHRRFKRALASVGDIVNTIVASRRASSDTGHDLLSLLMAARDDHGHGLSDEEIRNQVITFLLAGHETTACALVWCLSLLAQHPEEREKLERELDASTRAQPLTPETIGPLPRLDAIVRETVRLYPSIWIAERRVAQEVELNGFYLPRGSGVIVSPYATQRLEAYWPEPEAFRPERFLHGAPRTLLEHGYFPFGAGPHGCIGQHFATMEIKIVLAILLSNFRVLSTEKGLPEPLAGITLRPAAHVPVIIEQR